METYLTEIKQLRIPRPKFEPNSNTNVAGHHYHQQHWRHFVRPFTPPRDYHLAVSSGTNETAASVTVSSSTSNNNSSSSSAISGGARPRTTFQATAATTTGSEELLRSSSS